MKDEEFAKLPDAMCKPVPDLPEVCLENDLDRAGAFMLAADELGREAHMKSLRITDHAVYDNLLRAAGTALHPHEAEIINRD